MLREMFLRLLNLSLLAIPLMAVVLLLRPLLHRVPRRGVYAVWLLVLLRLMLPMQLSSPVSFYHLLPETTQEGTPVVVVDHDATVNFPVLLSPWEDNPQIDGGQGQTEPEPAPMLLHLTVEHRPVDWYLLLSTVWVCGVAVLCGVGLAGYLLVLHRLRKESFPLQLPIAEASAHTPVYQSGLFHTPVLCGLLRPKIILPMEMDTEQAETLSAVLSHEQEHIRRMDNFWRLLASITLYLHWFNPLVWVCYCAFLRDMEVSCDERVLATAQGDIRSQYANALLSLASAQVNPFYGGMLSFGESSIKERVEHIMSFQRAKLLGISLCAAVALGLAVVFLTNPSQDMAMVELPSSSVAQEQSVFAPIPSSMQAEPTLPVLAEPQTDMIAATPSAAAANPPPQAAVGNPVGKAEPASQGYGIRYDNSEVTYVYLLDQKNSSYRLIDDPVDRVNLVLAAVARKSTSGSGQVLIHTRDAKHTLNFDPVQDTSLSALCEELAKDAPNIAQWLAWMTDQNLIEAGGITYSENLAAITDCLKRLEVEPSPQIAPEGINPTMPAGLYVFDLTFTTGTTLRLFGFDDFFCISSSDMGPLTIRYQVKDVKQVDRLLERLSVIESGRSPAILPKKDDIMRMNLFHNKDKTYVQCMVGPDNDISQWLSLVSMLSNAVPIEPAALGAPRPGIDTLEVTRLSDLEKFVYRLYTHGFTVEGTAVEGETIASAYAFEKAGLWDLFCKDADSLFSAAPAPGAYWLGLMSDAKISAMTVLDRSTEKKMTYQYDQDREGQDIVELLRGMTVKTPYQSIDLAHMPKPEPDSVLVTVAFLNGINYYVNVGKTSMWITSSDMDYGLQYLLEGTCWRDDLLAYADAAPTPQVPVTADGVANPSTGKPVIYLYPERETDVSVRLDFDGKLTYTYPTYHSGWEVTASPDGTLKNHADGSIHYYLFWEGNANDRWEHDRGIVVEGAKTEAFLRKTLPILGLTPREYNDFITYWVPKMQENPYNLISFSGEQYGEIAKLTVTPKPDSILRVHMVWKALEAPVAIEPQTFSPFVRNGFTVVEWGGTEVFD